MLDFEQAGQQCVDGGRVKVTLVAYTALAIENSLDPVIERWLPPEQESGVDGDAAHLTEFAGRACYQAWSRPNPKTRRNHDYIANLLRQGHESVLEHASATFYIEGVSRALSHELIRHRHLSFSELSQRFVDMSEANYILPPAYREAGLDNPVAINLAECYEEDVAALQAAGYKRKQAREAARCQLPNATETRLVVSGNHRAWRDVLKRRYHVAADAELQELSTEILRQLRGIAPAIYADFPDQPFGTE